ncbi:MAG: hypothetical protein ABWY04_20060 [Arthrobacter sp.]
MDWNSNLVVLGAFHLDRIGDPPYEAFVSTGLWPPAELLANCFIQLANAVGESLQRSPGLLRSRCRDTYASRFRRGYRRSYAYIAEGQTSINGLLGEPLGAEPIQLPPGQVRRLTAP